MVRIASRFASALALAAALSMAATPAAARGYYGSRHHHHGIDGGDILAGVLILGGIAAIASAASNSSKNRQQVRDDYNYPPPAPRYQERYDYAPPPPPAQSSGYQSHGIDGAVDTCVSQVERGSTRVASVDNASRTADGWRIAGQLSQGGGFNCWIDNDGRVRQVDFGSDRYQAYNDPQGQGSQWSDQDYARARATQAEATDGPVDGDLAYAGN